MANDLSKEDVYVDKDGKRVSGDSPAAAFQIAFKGVKVDSKVASRYKDALGADEPRVSKKSDSDDATDSDSKARKSSAKK